MYCYYVGHDEDTGHLHLYKYEKNDYGHHQQGFLEQWDLKTGETQYAIIGYNRIRKYCTHGNLKEISKDYFDFFLTYED